ncbi:hypothetical protein [Mucilaginibacter polytrichastri]|uniref:Uncharacterized protein n=1 Tax=Mucilaginibacter polytrichastri TaxID=1302689 RepID=A0A1Q5ZZN6_9SPHI|nr:hypothetical protein [Mucilaginibacter polytrichastri]OKS87211.1 hypothetical protein RG47T_2670 [Mucilaginibacter polytrichastri]SFT19093.1 hypothetical protein SAMN04487890_11589 [Mucilaginibacter polytrichastri]
MQLELPVTLRTSYPNEVPQDQDILDRINLSRNANLVEGFTYRDNHSEEFPHKFSCEININNSNLWTFFKAFLLSFPEEIAVIYHHCDDEPTYSLYKDKFEILNILSVFEIEIVKDGFLELGIIHNTEDYLEEVFIKKGKYIQYWGMDFEKFKNIADSFSIHQIDDLNFIDEYPVTTEPLQIYMPETTVTSEVIKILDKQLLE